MKQFCSFLPFFLFPLFVTAQYLAHNDAPASNEYLTTAQPGDYWKPESPRINGRIGKKQLAGMQQLTQSIADFFKESVLSDNISIPTLSADYYGDKNSNTRFRFTINCNWKQEGSLTVTANNLSDLLAPLYINNKEYITIQAPTAIRNECPYFETDSPGKTSTKTWMITTGNNQLPYTAITRKEYLQEAKAELSGIIGKITATVQHNMPVRSAEMQEADKKKMLEQLQGMYSGSTLQVRTRMYLENYKNDETSQQERIEHETAPFRKTAELVDSLLQQSTAEELNKPAYVSVSAVYFNGFEDSDNNRMLIKINQDYFNANAAAEKAQFFLVSWTSFTQTTETAAIEKQLTEKFRQPLLRQFLMK